MYNAVNKLGTPFPQNVFSLIVSVIHQSNLFLSHEEQLGGFHYIETLQAAETLVTQEVFISTSPSHQETKVNMIIIWRCFPVTNSHLLDLNTSTASDTTLMVIIINPA